MSGAGLFEELAEQLGPERAVRVCEFLRYLGGFDLAGVAAVGCH